MALSAAIVLVAALAASPAATAPGGSDSKHSSDSTRADSYVLSIGNDMTSTNISIDEWARVHAMRSGDFLWFRRAGKAYLIEDPATLEQARELFAPLRALEPEQDDLRRRQEALEEKERDLDRQQEDLELQMDRLTDDDEGYDESMDREEAAPPTDAERAETEKELDDLRSRAQKLRPRQREIEAKNHELEAVERSLDAREEKLEKEAEAKVWILIEGAIKKGFAQPSSKP